MHCQPMLEDSSGSHALRDCLESLAIIMGLSWAMSDSECLRAVLGAILKAGAALALVGSSSLWQRYHVLYQIWGVDRRVKYKKLIFY